MSLTEFLRYMLAGMVGWVFFVGLLFVVLVFVSGHKAYRQMRRRR